MENPQDIQIQVVPFDSFYEFYKIGYGAPGGSGELSEATSRLMSRKKVQEEPEMVAEMTLAVEGLFFLQVPNPRVYYPCLKLTLDNTSRFVAGGAVARVDPDATGLNLAWREAVGLVQRGKKAPQRPRSRA